VKETTPPYEDVDVKDAAGGYTTGVGAIYSVGLTVGCVVGLLLVAVTHAEIITTKKIMAVTITHSIYLITHSNRYNIQK
jgi:hypothetical protein